MSFPACRHSNRRVSAAASGLTWLAAEPYRLFFASGALWSVVGVALWPLFYAGQLGFFPGPVHARLMIQAFGGGFVVGFLGTAGPRMASAPKLSVFELIGLFALHQAGAVAHVSGLSMVGDACFLGLLGSLVLALLVRVVRFRREAPPPPFLLAAAGLACGFAGTVLLMTPWGLEDAARYRLARLLLYQGFLLLPVLGIGAFLFPRMLGSGFGEPKSSGEARSMLFSAGLAAALIGVSFFIEAAGHFRFGPGLRAVAAAGYLGLEIRWRRQPGDMPRGSLTTGLFWALGLGFLGLVLTRPNPVLRVSAEHLLYIGGFGLLMLIVGSRVLFGHSGDLPGFHQRSHWARWLVFLGVLAATTRATPAWVPSTTVSHHIYAACTWGVLALGWLCWHGRRFRTRDAP